MVEDDDEDPALAPPPPEVTAPLLARLAAEPDPLFALLDGARSPAVLRALEASGEEHQSLYDGEEGEALAEVAPYLARLSPGSALLDTLVRRGWGNAWGLFVTSRRPFVAVRRHFRRFLVVTDEAGVALYFRFYDPRVLRAFLPTCSVRQLGQMFADVSSFSMEGEAPDTLLRFDLPRGGELEAGRVTLAGARGARSSPSERSTT